MIYGFKNSSHSASKLSRFFQSLGLIIEEIFFSSSSFSARFMVIHPGFYFKHESIEVSENDLDGKWNYDSTKKCWYYVYKILLTIDLKTHLPFAAMFTNGKHVGDK